jgi:disulfide bond formation protein DsbB
MSNLFNRFAMLVGLLTFILLQIGGKTIFTSLFRSIFVFIAVLFTFYIAGQLMKWGIFAMTVEEPQENKTEEGGA